MANQDVVAVRELLGLDALLLHCEWRTKKPVGKWKHLTIEAMEDPRYLARLGTGNIGVVLGPKSGGLCSLDIDSNDGVKVFAQLNQDICQTLCTQGQRGCNFWWKMEGWYPGLTVLKRNGLPWGEWRADGAQTIISGVHPSGQPYRFQNRLKPTTIAFGAICWPKDVFPRLLAPTTGVQDSSCTQVHRHTDTQETQVTQGNSCGSGVDAVVPTPFTVEEALAAAKTRAPGGNHDCLFKLARGIRAVEQSQGRLLPESDLENIVRRWFTDAAPHLKQGLSFDDYRFEFMDAYECVKCPLGMGLVQTAWKKVLTSPPPPSAERFQDMSVRQVVSLCRELWLSNGRKPFFLSCRTIQRLLGHPHHSRAALWLRGFVRTKILKVVEPGDTATRKATLYEYLPQD